MIRSRVALVCAILSTISAAKNSAQEPRLVRVAGRQVEVIAFGAGSPTLVPESGGGGERIPMEEHSPRTREADARNRVLTRGIWKF
jgi:hypothetical protein